MVTLNWRPPEGCWVSSGSSLSNCGCKPRARPLSARVRASRASASCEVCSTESSTISITPKTAMPSTRMHQSTRIRAEPERRALEEKARISGCVRGRLRGGDVDGERITLRQPIIHRDGLEIAREIHAELDESRLARADPNVGPLRGVHVLESPAQRLDVGHERCPDEGGIVLG